MPKKPPRNAFYFYMLDFKEEQRKKGVNYQNMAAIADAAGPLWKDAPAPVRAKFEAIAKKEKAKFNIPEQKFTSTGISFAEIEAQAREVREAEEREKKDIRNIVKLKAFNESIKFEDFFIMDVNTYCKAGPEYVVCEFTITRFNLTDGIKDEYHEMVNPGSIPIGYASDAKISCEELGVEMPDPDGKASNYMLILANLMDYLRGGNPNSRAALPAIFTLPDKVAAVFNFIQQLCHRSTQDDSVFRVYRLDTLFFTLINAIRSRTDEGFPKESLAMLQLKKDPFRYNPGLGCEHHESSTDRLDKAVECTMSRVKRWAFTILDHCCPVIGIELQPGTHLPADYDVPISICYDPDNTSFASSTPINLVIQALLFRNFGQIGEILKKDLSECSGNAFLTKQAGQHAKKILTYKEQKQQRAGPSVGGYSASCNSSVLSDSLNDAWPALSVSSGSVGTANSKPKRTHQPLRMPKTEFGKIIREAPDLTESNFPTLSVGVGRGRGMSSRSNNTN